MAGTARGKYGHKSHIKCQRPRATHSSKEFIPELKNRARLFLPKDSAVMVPRVASHRGPEVSQAALRLDGIVLIDHIFTRPQQSFAGTPGFLASTCHHLQSYSYFAPSFLCLPHSPDSLIVWSMKAGLVWSDSITAVFAAPTTQCLAMLKKYVFS